jgi:hypothetical protein
MQADIYKLLEEKCKTKSIAEYSLTYDSPVQQLEPIYYWLLDHMQGKGYEVEKLVDSFTATPGGGYFAEMSARATRLREEAMKYLGAINQVIKSIITLIWDLKEFEIRLKLYDGLKSKDEKTRNAALNALKEIWITNVDVKKGRGAINVLTAQLGFVTLRDAFFVAKKLEDVDKLDLNERVKNILRSRLIEFNQWLEMSEKELRNRYNIEKTYLKSQVASLKLYARWARPYIKAAEELMMKESKQASLVSAFSTMLLDLVLLCKKKYEAEKIPSFPKQIAKNARPFYGVVFIDFSFRSIPRVAGKEGYYTFGGRADILFKAYVLRQDELEGFVKEFEKKEFEETIRITQDVTEETLKTLSEDLKHFLEEEEKGKEEKEKEKKEKEKGAWEEGIITDIIGLFKKKEKGKEGKKEERKGKDNWAEQLLRKYVEKDMIAALYDIYNAYKKAHGMPSYSSPYG